MKETKICVIGLGYVGLPLARLFSTKYETVGFDINRERIEELTSGRDSTGEVDGRVLKEALGNGFKCTGDIEDIRNCNFYVVAVPTPVNRDRTPDLKPLLSACDTVGKVLGKGDVLVFESTVYPGVTEDVCAKKIENICGMKAGKDYLLGYSPERINPGDREHTVENIRKIVSGCNEKAAEKINEVYASVIKAGTYVAPGIRVAEAAKAVENTQRDVNIAFMNELKVIMDAMDIDVNEVIKAASTKWNFLPFKPGLVGGHCIGVDPYYLAQCAKDAGVEPDLILQARRTNESMAAYAADEVVRDLVKKGTDMGKCRILIMGFTFKADCPDIRNTKVADLYQRLVGHYEISTDVYDPVADSDRVQEEYGIKLVETPDEGCYDAVVVAVEHKAFENKPITPLLKGNGTCNHI